MSWKEHASNDYKKWLLNKGSELLLQGLFYSPCNSQVHGRILRDICSKDAYFSYHENISPSKDEDYMLWKNNKTDKKKNWQADGCIVNLNGEKIGLVEFKGFQNNYIKHNDIAKLLQYLYYASSKNLKVVWVARKSMIEDILWIANNIGSATFDRENFYRVCNAFTKKEAYKTGPSLADTNRFLKDKDSKFVNRSEKQYLFETYNSEDFRDFLSNVENLKKVRDGLDKLVLVNLDKGKAQSVFKGLKVINIWDIESSGNPLFLQFLEMALGFAESCAQE